MSDPRRCMITSASVIAFMGIVVNLQISLVSQHLLTERGSKDITIIMVTILSTSIKVVLKLNSEHD